MKNQIEMMALGCLAVMSVSVAFAQERRQPPTGTITGTVIDEAGKDVAGARIHVLPTDGRMPGHFVRYVESDKDGHFEMEHLEFGTYRVFTMNEEEAYPDTSSAIYDNGIVTECELRPESPKASRFVSIGPKAGTITGVIADITTGKTISTAGIRIWRWDNEKHYLDSSTEPEYRILVPANVATGIEIHAPGYQTWRHVSAGGSSESSPLLLKPGERLRFDVELRPLEK
jgi:hypothetical protein